MVTERQTTYRELAEILSNARISGKTEQIKYALKRFCLGLNDMVHRAESDPLCLSSFVYDEKRIFRADEEVFSNKGPDMEISTSGQLAQMLEMAAVLQAERLADEVRDTIRSLHARLSSHHKDHASEFYRAERAIDALVTAVEPA